MISKELTSELVKKYGKNEKDSGSTKVQIALLTHDIESLKSHFKNNPKDNHSKRGFMAKISKRKTLLSYLKAKDFQGYLNLIADLKIRK
ncbi:30S ribosomal protein S15 [Mycoplasma phocimorsus]|uniref:Small ribosomal subunit protein uS15 n=1 Tax=Mycoplasma phocimorsus TaxID=3045839 RepID=A0AAJ1UWL3_9MOLU|nr:30S ribosomal protein S15 [Mycoplasma phocimorsus]MDJ1645570.1 30S ribosomal protein S15 [Mycoplasma phocimorsus]MDJ1646105.1 30S ribosomal protein S15 [Mycoplasma phocimorsus]MDJ1646702.1 30S ribosomal protein S15 [Mycoplasma phocimorsus]